MALKEYRLNGGTHLFDSDNVPDGAELVGGVAKSVSPGSFDDLVMAAHDKRGRKSRRPANKAAPETKDEDESDDSDDSEDSNPEE